ncbi:serine acetyltransferase [Mucilaginibacter paludis]|uniref:Serine acetyltransferase n=1 Tax=Mucilaginibacter paludis DSM 18603 TaxID=714943 RepID=H1Y8U4_9SPHI|nr:serine acetyltransferase [Mucilaginibacter paludis]EHQ28710.1 transferase hexapeptide repeat containing protein [Mucilaginibacter paludis DSM 18603]
MNFFEFIFQDWSVNRGNIKGRLILLLFRIANFCSTRKIYYYIGFPYLLFYRILVEWFFSVEIPWNTRIGKNLSLYHGQALVMTNHVVIGENCTLRQSTTIGNKQARDGGFSGSPVIGNHVDIGSNVCLIGDIVVGDDVIIGCGAVVVKSVSACCIVTGNPGVERRRKDI